MAFVDISLFGGGEFAEAPLPRLEGSGSEPQPSIQVLLEKSVQRPAAHALGYVAEKHESQVAVMPRFPDAPAECTLV